MCWLISQRTKATGSMNFRFCLRKRQHYRLVLAPKRQFRGNWAHPREKRGHSNFELRNSGSSWQLGLHSIKSHCPNGYSKNSHFVFETPLHRPGSLFGRLLTVGKINKKCVKISFILRVRFSFRFRFYPSDKWFPSNMRWHSNQLNRKRVELRI